MLCGIAPQLSAQTTELYLSGGFLEPNSYLQEQFQSGAELDLGLGIRISQGVILGIEVGHYVLEKKSARDNNLGLTHVSGYSKLLTSKSWTACYVKLVIGYNWSEKEGNQKRTTALRKGFAGLGVSAGLGFQIRTSNSFAVFTEALLKSLSSENDESEVRWFGQLNFGISLLI
jgi:hypothetical protein